MIGYKCVVTLHLIKRLPGQREIKEQKTMSRVVIQYIKKSLLENYTCT